MGHSNERAIGVVYVDENSENNPPRKGGAQAFGKQLKSGVKPQSNQAAARRAPPQALGHKGQDKQQYQLNFPSNKKRLPEPSPTKPPKPQPSQAAARRAPLQTLGHRAQENGQSQLSFSPTKKSPAKNKKRPPEPSPTKLPKPQPSQAVARRPLQTLGHGAQENGQSQLNFSPPKKSPAKRSPSSRMKRRKRRATVVLDPCQETEQRRLLLEVLPRLQADRQSCIREHVTSSPPHDLSTGDKLRLRNESSLLITGTLGAGAYGTVFSAQPVVVNLGRRRPPQPKVVVKVASPPQLWEWYMHTALRERLPPTALATHIVPAIEAHSWGDIENATAYKSGVSVLVQPLAAGTLQQLIDAHHRKGEPVRELCALFLAASLLRAVHALHQADVLHADVRPDNIALRLDSSSSLDSNASITDDAGWAAHGVSLLDLGRAIDLRLYDKGTVFVG